MPTIRPPKRRSKYGNIRTEYGGRTYDSKAEAQYAARLDTEVYEGSISGWIAQPTFRLGCPENVYRPDFISWNADGTSQAIDVKGMRTAKFQRDIKLWRRYGPCPLWIVSGKKLEIVDPDPRDGAEETGAVRAKGVGR